MMQMQSSWLADCLSPWQLINLAEAPPKKEKNTENRRMAKSKIHPTSQVMPHVPCVCTMPHEVAAWGSFLHATFTFTSVDAAWALSLSTLATNSKSWRCIRSFWPRFTVHPLASALMSKLLCNLISQLRIMFTPSARLKLGSRTFTVPVQIA